MAMAEPVFTPDGRYLVVRGRLWRTANPRLPDELRQTLVARLMHLRRALRGQGNIQDGNAALRAELHEIKVKLGERGPVWWSDGQPDWNRHLIKNTPYGPWFAERFGNGKSGLHPIV
jgi:hypothetical protein